MDSSPYTQAELNQYKICPQISFVGSHIAGLSNCIYCAQIFRRYRLKQGTLNKIIGQQPETDLKSLAQQAVLTEAEDKPQLFRRNQNDDEDCGRLQCMRAGWCMCD